MRKLLFSLLAFALMYSCTTGPQYTINVKVDGLESGTAYLYDIRDVVDSLEFENGEFTFKGSVEMPELRLISFSDTMDYVQLFIENTEINVVVKAGESPEITGSSSQEKFAEFNESMSEFKLKSQELYNEFMGARMSNDEEKMKEVQEQYGQLMSEQEEALNGFIANNTNSVVSAFIAQENISRRLDINELDSLIQIFDPSIANSTYIVKMKEHLATLKKIDIGQPYTEITQPDTEGNMVSLSSFVGNGYVLIDFWASWCNPCRAENPFLVENYAKYKDKGFEIFGISLDRDKNAWIKGIEDDGITWPQVFNTPDDGKSAADLYLIYSIPQNLLLDKDGIIIAKNLRGEELGAKLVELFGE